MLPQQASEASSAAGVGVIASALMPFIPPTYQGLWAAGCTLFGALAVFIKERQR